MHRSRVLIACLMVIMLALVGCGGSGPTGSASGGSGSGSASGSGEGEATAESVFALDSANEATLDITADGGGVALKSGEATAAVYAPPGAADGASWKVTPLADAPEGVEGVIVPGFEVQTNGIEPKKTCSIGFAVPGTVPANTTVVRYADDGASFEVVPSMVATDGAQTLVTAWVDGFSAYGVATADAADIEAAAQAAPMVDWTIKAGGTETQTNQGWTFDYEFDFFASGAGVAQGGVYRGYATLFVEGTYEGPESIVASFGDVKGGGRDDALRFYIVDEPLASLIDGSPVGDPIVSGAGVMNIKGMSELNAVAVGPTVSGQYNSGQVEGSSPTPFTILVNGEDVQIEIPNVGIFPGKILRTEL